METGVHLVIIVVVQKLVVQDKWHELDHVINLHREMVVLIAPVLLPRQSIVFFVTV